MAFEPPSHDQQPAQRAFGYQPAPPPPPQQPAAVPGQPPFTPSGEQMSGWWRRVAAYLLDALIAGAIALAISFLLGFALGLGLTEMGAEPNAEDDGWVLASYALAFVVGCLYAPILMARGGARNGQTIGKQALGIRVVRTNREPVTFWNGVLRTAVAQQLLTLLTFYIWALFDYLWPLGDSQNQALHDKLAKTWVIRTTAPTAAPPQAFQHATSVVPPPTGQPVTYLPPVSTPPPAPAPADEAPVQGWLPPRSGA